jgi:hypothetical protein
MRFLFRRPLPLLTAATISYAVIQGGTQAGQQAAILAAVLWIITLIARRAWSRRRRRTPRALIARPSRSTPWGPRDPDVSGCFARLDPAWRLWLQPETAVTVKGIHHG